MEESAAQSQSYCNECMQVLERKLASAEADCRKKDDKLEQAYYQAKHATEKVELEKSGNSKVSSEFGACSGAL